MMRFLFVMILTAIASWLALVVMPWWIPLPIAFFIILICPMKNGRAFLATGAGAALCYLLYSINADQANEHILSTKMAALFHLPSYAFMIVVTTLIGFITAGLGGWTGAALRNLLRPYRSKQEQFVSKQSQP
jgi:hypothetical protein